MTTPPINNVETQRTLGQYQIRDFHDRNEVNSYGKKLFDVDVEFAGGKRACLTVPAVSEKVAHEVIASLAKQFAAMSKVEFDAYVEKCIEKDLKLYHSIKHDIHQDPAKLEDSVRFFKRDRSGNRLEDVFGRTKPGGKNPTKGVATHVTLNKQELDEIDLRAYRLRAKGKRKQPLHQDSERINAHLKLKSHTSKPLIPNIFADSDS